MSMNWDDILKQQEQDPGFAPVPESKYPVRVEKAEATKASTGADMIKLQLVIMGGPYDTKKVFTNIVFSKDNPTAMRFTLRKLAALGVTREVLSAQNPSLAQIASMLEGATAEAEVTVREYEGEKTNDVKSLRKLGETGPGTPSAAGAAPSVPTPPAPTPDAATPPIPTPPAPEAAPSAPVPEPEAAPAEGSEAPAAYDPAEEPF